MIDYVHTQLSIWGKWVVRSESRALGYPSVCPMFKDIRHGGGYGSSVPVGVSIADESYVSDTDEAVKRLRIEHRRLIVEFYVVGGRSVEIAARVGVTKKRLYELLDVAHQQVLCNMNDVVAGV